MRDIADDLGARFEDNPLWWTHRVVTVHPLGGAPMGRHVAEGVCDANGEVFGFPGLYVARRVVDARAGRRQPVADDRRRRRPRLRQHPGTVGAARASARARGHHAARAGQVGRHAERLGRRSTGRRDEPVVHRGDEGLRRARLRRPGHRRTARSPARSAADVPPHDHGRRRRPLRRRPGSPRHGHRVRRVRPARRAASRCCGAGSTSSRGTPTPRDGGCSTGCTSPTRAATR